MLTTNQTERLAKDLRDLYDFPALIGQFAWGGEVMPGVWTTRERLMPASTIADAQAAAEYAAAVHRWGFNGKNIRSEVTDAAAWPQSILSLVKEWQSTQDPLDRQEALQAMQSLLEFKFLGMATVTKWTCFLDQSRYAIYDSRVSYALRGLLIDNLRVFPFVGARVGDEDRSTRVVQDACVLEPAMAVTTYVNFLRVIRRTAALLEQISPGIQWTPARVECCLFVAGEHRLRENSIRPLNSAVNAAWAGVV